MKTRRMSYVTYEGDPEVWAQIKNRSVLFIDNETQQEVLDMEDCISVMEEALRDEAEGAAVNGPYWNVFMPTLDEEVWHQYVSMQGAARKWGVAAIRIRSNLHIAFDAFGRRRRDFHAVAPGVYSGLVFLFGAQDGALLAILNDGHIQHVRTGACSGVAAKYMSRQDADTVGILGSGGMAITHAWAMPCVRNVKQIKVYSPNPDHRTRFAEQLSKDLEIDVVALDTPRDVVQGSDIICTGTNANEPVVMGDWLEPGMHIDLAAGRLDEAGESRVGRWVSYMTLRTGMAQGPVFTTPESWRPDLAMEGGAPEREFPIPEERMSTLPDVVTGQAVGRATEQEINAFHTVGTGVQFADIGFLAYQKAQEHGLGTKLPLEMFLQNIHS